MKTGLIVLALACAILVSFAGPGLGAPVLPDIEEEGAAQEQQQQAEAAAAEQLKQEQVAAAAAEKLKQEQEKQEAMAQAKAQAQAEMLKAQQQAQAHGDSNGDTAETPVELKPVPVEPKAPKEPKVKATQPPVQEHDEDDYYDEYDYEELYQDDAYLYDDEEGIDYDYDDEDYDDYDKPVDKAQRREDDIAAFQEYLDQTFEDMLHDPKLRDEMIDSILDKQEEGEKTSAGDEKLLELAMRLRRDEKLRNHLEEQERRIIERQRRTLRREQDQEMGINSNLPGSDTINDVDRKVFRNMANSNNNDANVAEDSLSTNGQLSRIGKERLKVLGDISEKSMQAFRQHEFERELRFRQEIARMKSKDEKQAAIERHKKMMEELKNRKGNAPMHKQQLQDVWEKEDHMEGALNPKTFFALHDITNDGYLDQKELEALFIREAEDLHEIEGEELDLVAVREEVARIRRHVMEEVDTDKDGLISRLEFFQLTDRDDFEENSKWDALFPEFTEEELKQYRERRKRAIANDRKEHVDPNMSEALKRSGLNTQKFREAFEARKANMSPDQIKRAEEWMERMQQRHDARANQERRNANVQ
eukprot:m.354993 g.354993  ORF g.354993 m.354993 type:complete len:589 (+) comp17152_c0_seq1:348-2114(+)